MIDLVMLKDFLVLCRIKSFSRAAQECHVSVSGLSRRIQTLEQWLGAPVFERHKHALELTEAGRQLQGVAQDAVRALATPLSIREIAYEVGYENVSFFVRLFRKEAGDTPSHWRGRVREPER